MDSPEAPSAVADGAVQEAETSRHQGGYGADPGLLVHIADAATYVSLAALGGVIGNRADAGTVATARGLLRSVVSRWRKRQPAPTDDVLLEDEAQDIAYAAALTLEYVVEEDRLSVQYNKRDGDRWLVRLRYRQPDGESDSLIAFVDAGDPSQAKVMFLPYDFS